MAWRFLVFGKFEEIPPPLWPLGPSTRGFHLCRNCLTVAVASQQKTVTSNTRILQTRFSGVGERGERTELLPAPGLAEREQRDRD